VQDLERRTIGDASPDSLRWNLLFNKHRVAGDISAVHVGFAQIVMPEALLQQTQP
jgi:hypothetical protein